ncbi:MAG: T9SS type A sorting domain-containing protein [Bacteroidales bacterium]|nr:T9SS type A sorting domain-containing protein [Bacteroidales bacterium]
MKTLTTLIFSLLALSAWAQIPAYFANNPEWRQISDCADGLPCVEQQNYVYYLNGDSTSGGLIYKKLYKRGVVTHQWFDSPPIPDYCNESWTFNEFNLLIRQEERKIYIRQWDETEALLYDFDLAVGDTLPITWNQWHEDIIVTSIDSVQVGDSYRKVFNLSEQSSPQLIEGIGHEGGFLEPFPPMLECGYIFMCYALNGTTYYPNEGEPCDLSVGVETVSNAYSITSYPNPASGQVTIGFENPALIRRVLATNISGQMKELNFKQENARSIVVDLSKLAKGLYMIQLNIHERASLLLKVFKE